ncbi:S-layer homology domain-containing protein [Tenuibacillus multivorans]|uniref:Transglycosylase SLT domain-containing protein n=1 Tax=Tenuibacillus multivorans TaxID=237069 RepID=A0A1H0C080_9BACI|nr:S-layer homology domain-containing protein [Tenuibacillus multivorans]GEL78588.1 hypothetical protein TMU01_28230 [Tenuibacillus multivorans]SDN51206.1 Transglycosylase SLT domain-containing protein [Tenuibacillus multivorans]
MKNLIHILVVTMACLLLPTTTFASTEDVAKTCNYTQEEGENPDLQTMNCLLTETALNYDVPPEIVKAIAEGESGDWRHFDENGDVIITEDNGIGIMQITDQEDYDEDRLKTDILYNIKTGVEILDDMYERTDLPTINDNHRDFLEHWYFAIMAYNGTKPINSPIVQETGERNTDAYQEKILNIVEDYSLVELEPLSFTPDEFDYDPDSDENIDFVTTDYQFDQPLTKTKHKFEEGQPVTATTSINIRTNPTTDSAQVGTLKAGDVATISGPFEYDDVASKKNHFVWYPVELNDGTTGYAASSYLTFKFSDVPAGHYAEKAIQYLAERDILSGIGNGKFGLNQELTRWQAVLLLNRANDVSTTNRPDLGFTDIDEDYLYYDNIAAAVEENYFSGYENNTFRPNITLTRAEMASTLQRIYQFPGKYQSLPFSDVPSGKWYTDAVTNLYHAGITVGVTESEFGPSQTITREQFAVFLARSINENFSLEVGETFLSEFEMRGNRLYDSDGDSFARYTGKNEHSNYDEAYFTEVDTVRDPKKREAFAEFVIEKGFPMEKDELVEQIKNKESINADKYKFYQIIPPQDRTPETTTYKAEWK